MRTFFDRCRPCYDAGSSSGSGDAGGGYSGAAGYGASGTYSSTGAATYAGGGGEGGGFDAGFAAGLAAAEDAALTSFAQWGSDPWGENNNTYANPSNNPNNWGTGFGVNNPHSNIGAPNVAEGLSTTAVGFPGDWGLGAPTSQVAATQGTQGTFGPGDLGVDATQGSPGTTASVGNVGTGNVGTGDVGTGNVGTGNVGTGNVGTGTVGTGVAGVGGSDQGTGGSQDNLTWQDVLYGSDVDFSGAIGADLASMVSNAGDPMESLRRSFQQGGWAPSINNLGAVTQELGVSPLMLSRRAQMGEQLIAQASAEAQGGEWRPGVPRLSDAAREIILANVPGQSHYNQVFGGGGGGGGGSVAAMGGGIANRGADMAAVMSARAAPPQQMGALAAGPWSGGGYVAPPAEPPPQQQEPVFERASGYNMG